MTRYSIADMHVIYESCDMCSEMRVEILMQYSRTHTHLGARIAGLGAEVLERDGERQVLAERVPAQVALLHELLHVLGRRAAGAGLVPVGE
jgi:hypothetical protein